ncbi:hypothetical protein [Actinomadura sp. SCN-SB]|uniref:hypothetical protein n=1 Tax=Actinomadura sp. SCN-SB TaxID=3373092 RepID=UPI0037504730
MLDAENAVRWVGDARSGQLGTRSPIAAVSKNWDEFVRHVVKGTGWPSRVTQQ